MVTLMQGPLPKAPVLQTIRNYPVKDSCEANAITDALAKSLVM
jgi:hypothetical protein